MDQRFVAKPQQKARPGRPHVIGGGATLAFGLLVLVLNPGLLALALVIVGMGFVILGSMQNSRA